MKLILTQSVEKLGKPGEIVTVADGYGRNFLLPRQFAIPANKGNLKQAERLAAEHEKREAKIRTDAESVAARIAASPITITARVGQDTTKLYGSVTASDIAEALQTQAEIEVDRRRIQLDEPIRSLGEYVVPIRLHENVTGEIRLTVAAFEEKSEG
jgi:large subunit ribosomal protein L9